MMIVNGQRLSNLERNLKSYGLVSGDRASLHVAREERELYISSPDYDNFKLEINTEETIGFLLKRIHEEQKILDDVGLHLQWRGKDITDEKHKTMKEFMDNDQVDMHLFKRDDPPAYEMDICISFERKRDIPITVKPSSSLAEVKVSIEKITGVPPSQQRIIFCGKQVEDGLTLDDYNVIHGSTLYLWRRLRGD